MSSRSLARPASFCAALAMAAVALPAVAQTPAVPPVSEIPVAPLPKPKKAQAPTPPAAPQGPSTTTTVTTTTVTTPALVAVTPDVATAPVPAPGAAEAMPAAAPPRVLITDELPSRGTRTRAGETTEHPRKSRKHGRHGRPYHPAPGIVVEVTEASGTSAADLQRAARNLGYWPFRHCYEEALERNQQLSGSVSLSLSRLADPSTTDAAVQGSTIKDEMVPLCVAREAEHLQLPWAAAPADARADLKVTLSTGDDPVPVPHAIPHAEEVRHALRASFPQVQQCFASGLAHHPDIGGRMELRFRTKSDGEVLEVSEDEPRFSDVDVTRCVLGVYRTAKLPPIHGVHGGTFVYSLHFEAAPAAK